MNIEQMKNIDRSKLKQLSSVKIDPKLSREKRIQSLFEQINPYCYLDGKTVVISRFADTGKTIEDCFCEYLSGV